MKRPSYQVVSIHAAKRRNWRGFVLQQKLDGFLGLKDILRKMHFAY